MRSLTRRGFVALAAAAAILPRATLAAPVRLLAFGDFPDRWTMIGAGIICLSGLYIAHRERQLARARSSG